MGERVDVSQLSGGRPSEKLALWFLTFHADSNGDCWASVSSIVRVLECSERQAIRLLSQLERSGLLVTQPGWTSKRLVQQPQRFKTRLHQASETVNKQRQKEARRKALAKSKQLDVYKRDGFVCSWCGETDDLTIDHIIPVSKGGSDDPNNLRVLCRSCNCAKGDNDG